ncbi:MAG: hypothetical protein V4644_00780 [Patescibacteria group bacterium]
MPPTLPENDSLKALLEENLAVAKDNNRLLREMRRNAILGLILKIVIWLVILGVPLLVLSSYLGPLMEAVSAPAGSGAQAPAGLFGLPSQAQMSELIEQYQAAYQ